MNLSLPSRGAGRSIGPVLLAAAAILGILALVVQRRDRPATDLTAATPPSPQAQAGVSTPASTVREGSGTELERPPADPGRPQAPARPAAAAAAVTAAGSADPDTLSTDRFSDPGYPERLKRHASVQAYRRSPVRDTEVCRGIATLCERFGYGPWAVSLAYNLAYEHTQQQKRRAAAPPPAAYREEEAQLSEAAFAQHVGAQFDRQGAPVDPAFVEALRDYQPTEFFGQIHGLQGQTGDRMLDRIDWTEWRALLEAEAEAETAEAPPPTGPR